MIYILLLTTDVISFEVGAAAAAGTTTTLSIPVLTHILAVTGSVQGHFQCCVRNCGYQLRSVI